MLSWIDIEELETLARKVLNTANVEIEISAGGLVYLTVEEPFEEVQSYALGTNGQDCYIVRNGKMKPSMIIELKKEIYNLAVYIRRNK